ncbi:hypothetical protein QLG10_19810 [Pseudomonas sp. V98_8]|jgi:hypothetical protein|uniref:hypothetical protein n=1 Tax=Pseudomonas sp. V98_8 TaxID=3044228 RepID=UPI00249E51CA|nr:hypothetical protein [Pseudomonas sp. V98_8]MDI3394684.1 hypothetical protein [Pseudomonas sp. V98_8]
MKIINTSIAPPGAGKTEALLCKLPGLIEAGMRVILAVPTLILSDEISHRAANAGITSRSIDHRSAGVVITELNMALADKTDSFIVCTQESIRQARHNLLHGWVLVVDELPKVVDYPDYPLKPVELKRVLDFTEERDGQLWLGEGYEVQVKDQVSTNRADARGTDCSTLGPSAANIFRLLLSGVDVFIDKEQSNGIRHIRAVEEYTDWWEIFSAASETHVLAANVQNSEFELFAKVHSFYFKPSIFTPKSSLYKSFTTIYPVTPKGQLFSKGKMLSQCGDKRLIDLVLEKVLAHTRSIPLLSANKWAGFESRAEVRFVPKDCRGVNRHSDATEAILLFGGNPSPSDKEGLKYLKAKYGENFEEAFITTRLLEPSLQVATRTAVRCHNNSNEINLYVQDERVVAYLLTTYFQHAKVDWSVAGAMPIKRDGRKLDEQAEEKVKRLIELDTPTIQIHRETGVSRKKIQKMKEIYQAA